MHFRYAFVDARLVSSVGRLGTRVGASALTAPAALLTYIPCGDAYFSTALTGRQGRTQFLDV